MNDRNNHCPSDPRDDASSGSRPDSSGEAHKGARLVPEERRGVRAQGGFASPAVKVTLSILIIALLILGAWVGVKYLQRSRDRAKALTGLKEVQDSLTSLGATVCLRDDDLVAMQSEIEGLKRWLDSGDLKSAIAGEDSLLRDLIAIGSRCAEYLKLSYDKETALPPPGDTVRYRRLEDQFYIMQESFRQKISARAFAEADNFRAVAKAYLDSMTALPVPPPAPVCSEQSLASVRQLRDRIAAGCRSEADGLYDNAKRACESGDTASMTAYRQQLEELAAMPECFNFAGELSNLEAIPQRLADACQGEAQGFLDAAGQASQASDKDAFLAAKAQLIALSREARCKRKPSACPESIQALVDNAHDSLAAFIDRYKNLGKEYYGQASGYQGAVSSINTADSALRVGNCAGAEFNATTAINFLQEVRPCENLADDAGRVLACVKEQVTRKPEDKSKYEANRVTLERSLRQCSCAEAQLALNALKLQLPSECLGAPPVRGATFAQCESAHRNRSADAWSICQRVPPSDPRYQEARRLFVIEAGREKVCECDATFRQELQDAFTSARSASVITVQDNKENAYAHITMVLAYGWDTTAINCDSARAFYLRAKDYAASADNPNWWKAKLVALRCAFRGMMDARRLKRDEGRYSDEFGALRKELRTMVTGIPGREIYQAEIDTMYNITRRPKGN